MAAPPPLCLKCGEVGHIRGKCPRRRIDQDNVVNVDSQQSPPPTAAQRIMSETVAKQRGDVVLPEVDEDDDLDLLALQAESQLSEGIPSPQSEFYHDTSTTDVRVAFAYGEDQVTETPEPVQMDVISPARKAEDDNEPFTQAKRIRITAPIRTPPISSVFNMELRTDNRFSPLDTDPESSELSDN